MSKTARLTGPPGPQTVGTPPELISAIEKEFNIKFQFDLAADASLHICENYYTKEDDSLNPDTIWPHTRTGFSNWLNPPFAKPRAWLERALYEKLVFNTDTFVLLPALVSTAWYRDLVEHKASIYFLSPRPKFVGYDQTSARDIMLMRFSNYWPLETKQWRWKGNY
jgi:phage N-6-adenine-methyltransferase